MIGDSGRRPDQTLSVDEACVIVLRSVKRPDPFEKSATNAERLGPYSLRTERTNR